ncbi:MAG TPA: hypothetical protein PK514_09545 [Spirochaetota bacterium]|nr:hypothetical protein [Spirochaetota bacterium]
MKTGLLIAAAFAAFFIFIWGNVLALLSLISGWRKLGILSPAPGTKDPGAVTYSFQSMRLGFVNYNRCARTCFTGAGVIFSTVWPFTFMHSPFIIRYEKISGIKKGNFFGPYIEFTAEDKKIRLAGKSALELEKRIGVPGTAQGNHT